MATTWLGSVLAGSVSAAPVRFGVGDIVDVLRACHLPKREIVLHTGTIQRVDERDTLPALYWIAGLACARTAHVLRLVQRAR